MVKTLKVLIDAENTHLKQEHKQNLAWEDQFIRIEDQLRHAIAALALRPEVVKNSYAAVTGIPTNTENFNLVPAEIPDLATFRPGQIIIHTQKESGIKKIEVWDLICKTNKVLKEMEAKVDGEQIMIKAI
ncbi:hypothetical protein PPACK8108_LOCUS16410 [Phakopsora pachyrhizi]|uniref:Uncharacterized protein n=1 Tax=Phakopsora pachyrhizi TaxID=170000 RepID=A0AAV0B826_PHAPC|nr:hypothetical protein PPACK8108_LOCUS16410 [Phakopsora pachyrhizi]